MTTYFHEYVAPSTVYKHELQMHQIQDITVLKPRIIQKSVKIRKHILCMGKQRILVVKVIPDSKQPGTFLFGASPLWTFGHTDLKEIIGVKITFSLQLLETDGV